MYRSPMPDEARLLREVRKAFDTYTSSHAKYVEAVRAPHDYGITWRQLGEAVGKSHEHMRSVARSKKLE
jgi:hypothetical protein